jgi:RimJ/RimL family protein N-acetyltransferase
MTWNISKAAEDYLDQTSRMESRVPARPAIPLFDKTLLKQYATTRVFKDHLSVCFRPIQPDDAGLLQELFHSHSKETILHRYFAPIGELSADQLQRFVAVDYRQDFALIGLIPCGSGQRMIAVGRYYRNVKSTEAEVAITLHDGFQGLGIGTFLTRSLIKIAMEHGITAFRASVLADNCAMMHVFQKMADRMTIERESGVSELRFELSEKAWPKNE